jgi:3-phenylpropionate/trans-cinnamate dioxygenase ferredoxin subunit
LINSKNLNWYKIAEDEEEINFLQNDIAVLAAGGKRFCLGKYNGNLFAFAFNCPHAGGILAEGWIDASGNIVCPMHKYKFKLLNGRNVSGEGYYMKHWPVERRSDGIFVGFEESKI